MDKATLENLIKTAFAGVGLDRGMSLLQAEVADGWGMLPGGVTPQQYERMLREEPRGNWALVKPEELGKHYAFAHLDSKGLRYYMPICMVLGLQDSKAGVFVEHAIMSLSPDKKSLDYFLHRIDLFTEAQRIATAHFLYWMAHDMGGDSYYFDQIQQGIELYWHQYLHTFICALEFEIIDQARFHLLQDVFARFQNDKENKTRTSAEDWLLLFDDQALSHFRWPTPLENADLWQQWYATSAEERRYDSAFFSAPWHFEFWLEAIYEADYQLVSCEMIGPNKGRLSYSCLHGSVEALEALIEAFEGKVTARIDGSLEQI